MLKTIANSKRMRRMPANAMIPTRNDTKVSDACQEAFMDRKPEDKPKAEKSVLESKKKFSEQAGDEKLKHMDDKPAKSQSKPGQK
jgi:hypothetical protein